MGRSAISKRQRAESEAGANSHKPVLSRVYEIALEPVDSGRPVTVTAAFRHAEDRLKAIAAGKLYGMPYRIEIESDSFRDEEGDIISFTIEKVVIDMDEPFAALRISGLHQRIARISLTIPAGLAAENTALNERWGGTWKYRGGYTGADHMIKGTPTLVDGDVLIAAAEIVPKPTGLAATGVAEHSVTLSWDAVDGATKYIVYRNGYDEEFRVEGTTYTDPDLAPDTPYSYTVMALRNDFESEISEQISVTTKGQE